MNRTMKRLVLPVGAAAILGTTGFAYMASSGTLNTSYASIQTGSIDGYTVSGVHFTTTPVPGTDDKRYITAVSFNLDNPAAAANVTSWIDDSQSGRQFYQNCVNTNGTAATATSFTCNENSSANQAQPDTAIKLTVRASQ